MLAFTKASAPPKFRTLLKGHTCQAQLYVKRYSISDIPYNDESKCAQWLHELFQEKVFFFFYFYSPWNILHSGSSLSSFCST